MSRSPATKEPGYSRKRLIAAASALLQEVGYDGFTVRKLGDRLGQTAAALYMHFADKDALLRAVLDQEFADAARGWFASHPPASRASPRDRLLGLLHFYLSMGLGNPISYRIRFFHDRGADPQIRGWAEGRFDESDNARNLRDAVADWLDAGGRAEPSRVNLVFLEIWGMMHGLILAFAPAEMPTEDKISTALEAVTLFLEGINA